MDNVSASDASGAQARDKRYRIIVNGEEKTVDSMSLSYEEVVRLAFPVSDPNTIYRVTFRKAEHPHEGTLVEGQTVEIKEGTIFDVTSTGKS